MGRFTLPLRKALLVLAISLPVQALVLEGVKLPPTKLCAGKELPLLGAGLRKATFLGIRVYVLAHYAVNRTSRPQCYDLTYLRDFDNDDVDKAWDFQFKESAEHTYPALKEHIMDLKKYFGAIDGDRHQGFELDHSLTRVFEHNKFVGEIKGEDFQKSFLSIWFGANPPSKELQEALLKKVSE